jgi:hypothetical protein
MGDIREFKYRCEKDAHRRKKLSEKTRSASWFADIRVYRLLGITTFLESEATKKESKVSQQS